MQLQKCAKKRAALTSTILFLAASRVTHRRAARTRVRCKTEMHILLEFHAKRTGKSHIAAELLLLELDTYTDRVRQHAVSKSQIPHLLGIGQF